MGEIRLEDVSQEEIDKIKKEMEEEHKERREAMHKDGVSLDSAFDFAWRDMFINRIARSEARINRIEKMLIDIMRKR